LGTAAYLSPEQVSTGDAGPRSDVYSIGILAYELLTGVTPFTGDSALAIAYQRMDNDVPPPSRTIAGVPGQFDELVTRATAREPAARYADAQDMAAELDAIVNELGLPPFRVPAPRNSAQHLSAALHHSHIQAQQETTTATTARPPAPPVLAPRQQTRELTRDDWQPQEPEYEPVSGQFAGIDLDEFYWARHRAKRALVFWVITVLTLTGLIAAAAWTLGGNIGTLI
jgi:serine/threonine-protein kinase